MLLNRRRTGFKPVYIAVFAVVALFYLWRHWLSSSRRDKANPEETKLHVAIVNAPRYHFEVVLPLLHAFARQPSIAFLELVAANYGSSRFGVRRFLEAQIPKKNGKKQPLYLREPKTISADSNWQPDVMLLVSCKDDIEQSSHVRDALERVLESNQDTRLICMVHEIGKWHDKNTMHRRVIDKWARKGRVEFMVLSPHVKDALEQEILRWDIGTPEVLPVFIPVFPLDDNQIKYDPTKPQEPMIGIPGKYESWRRSYKPMFRSLAEHKEEATDKGVSLHLVGFGDHPSPIPMEAEPFISFHDNLNFDAYWRTLRSMLAIATAFASDHYITDQASSTIATALIVGSPLICGRDILHAYRYLSEDDVWILEENEEVMQGFLRVASYGQEVWREKRRRVAIKMQQSVRDNVLWLSEYLRRKRIDSTWKMEQYTGGERPGDKPENRRGKAKA